MTTVKKRHWLPTLKQLLKQYPVVAILGSRQVGKSTLIRQALPKASAFDLERESDYIQIHRDVEFFLDQTPQPVIFDEAQLSPKLFSQLRAKIDENRQKNGQYLISGSSSPELIKAISESLAGRVAIMELSPFTWSEQKQTKASLLYTYLLNKQFEALITLKKKHSNETVLQYCVHGGYPDVVLHSPTNTDRLRWFDNYVQTYINRDIRRLFPGLQMETYTRFIRMLAASSNQFINYSHFARALDVSQPTVKQYFEIAQGTYLWRYLKAFSANPIKAEQRAPKGHIRDSGLLCHLLNINDTNTLTHHPQFGLIWESCIIEQLLNNFQAIAIPIKANSYRTRHNAEIDLILEGPFGIIPIEIKSGKQFRIQQLQSMQEFMKNTKCAIGIIINTAEKITWLTPNIIQIPATYI